MTNRNELKLAAIWLILAIGSSLGAVSPSTSTNVENTKLAPAPSSVGAVYREARGYRIDDSDNYYNPRQYERPQSRCISCLYATMAGNPDRNRYFDQSYYNYRPAYGPQRENEDRNWYYQPDRYDNRYDNRHAPYENRGYYQSMQPNRYGDNNRYDQYRPGYGNYDRNDNRQNYQDYRGNGYDNRDPMYYNSMKGGQYGGANNYGMGSSGSGSYAPSGYGGSGSLNYGSGSGGANYAPGSGSYSNRDGGYESNYYDDRMSNRGYSSSSSSSSSAGYGSPNYYMRPNINENRPEYYDRNNNAGYGMFNTGHRGGYGGYTDERIFRPWDQTNRGVSGFDNLGHGHYFASNPAQPQLPQTNPHQQAPPRPFGFGGSGGSGVSGGSGGSQYHHESSTHSHSPNSPNSPNSYQYDAGNGYNQYGTNANGNKGGGSSGTGSYGGNNWHYVNSNTDHHNSNHQQQGGYAQQSHNGDKDSQQSSPYGDRQGQRPLSTSYLHERDTPTIVGKDNGSDASDTNQTKQNTSNNEENHSDNNNTNNDNGVLKRPNDETSTNNIATSTNANDA